MISQRPEIQILAAALEGLPLDARAVLVVATLVGAYAVFGVLLGRLWGRRSPAPEWMAGLQRPACWIALRSSRLVPVVFLVAFLSGLSNGLVRYPIPAVNDEFGYLLTADTFAHGRLANPQHPLWRHFETIGVSHDPAYIAKYPPATSAFLALGQVVFGHPWWGQLLAYSLGAAALAWMLRAWVGPRWAVVSGMIVALHPNLQHFHHYDYGWANYSWSHSYWGGAAAMLGAALLFGGMRHFLRRPRAGYGFALAVGLALLANTRPMEGFFVSLAVAAVLVVRVATGRLALPRFLHSIVVPVALVMLPTAGLMALNNQTTTGDPFRLAHQHYGGQYGAAAELLIQTARTPPEAYGNSEMERFYLEWVRPTFESRSSSWDGYLESRRIALEKFFWFFFSTSWPALLVVALVAGRRWVQFACGVAALTFIQMLVVFDFHPHYASAAIPMFFALLAWGLASLIGLSDGRSMLGRAVVVVVLALSFFWRVVALPSEQYDERVPSNDWPRMRAFLVQQLSERPGRDLVLVSTAADHLMFQNWVHNGADLEEGAVIFARDLDLPLEFNPLVQHYADREFWHLELRSDTWSFRPLDRKELLAGS